MHPFIKIDTILAFFKLKSFQKVVSGGEGTGPDRRLTDLDRSQTVGEEKAREWHLTAQRGIGSTGSQAHSWITGDTFPGGGCSNRVNGHLGGTWVAKENWKQVYQGDRSKNRVRAVH